MKNKFIKKWIKDPIFGGNFWFCIGVFEDFIKFADSKTDEDLKNQYKDAQTDGMCLLTDDDIHFIWLGEKDYATMVHELIHHTCNALVRRYQLMFDEDTEEVFACYMEFLFKECNKILNEKKNPKTT